MFSEIQLKSVEHYGYKRGQIQSTYPSILGLSDSAIYTYTKDAAFLRPKQERNILFFFQGLNTNPQNLSIFLMSQATSFQQFNQNSKQKITKGVFHVYDIYHKWDGVIEVNIPGNLKIYKVVEGKKQIVSSEEIDFMYISSIMRTFFEKNLCWGRYYEIFKDSKDNLAQFNYFLKIFFRIALKHQFFISEQFQSTAEVKGSHSLTLLLRFVKQKRINTSCLTILQAQMEKDSNLKKSPKFNVFMAQLFCDEGKFSKSIQCTISMTKQYSNDPYILYYKAKYLCSLLMIDEALKVLNYISQYNQFEVWTMLAKIHCDKKNYTESLICINNAAKISKYRAPKPIQASWKAFEQIGRPRPITVNDPIHFYVKLNIKSQNPLSIPSKNVEQKYKPILEHPAWKLNLKEKQIYKILQNIFYKTQLKKFQQLLQDTFQEEKTQIVHQVAFKKGLTQSMFIDQQHLKNNQQTQTTKMGINMKKKHFSLNQDEQLPHFLKEQYSGLQNSVYQDNRNLSIIPEIESVIQSSNYEEKEPQQVRNKKLNRRYHKREMNEQTFKILKVLFSDGQFQKAVHESNYQKILPIYNKLRVSAIQNNFYFIQMFKCFVQTGNFKSIVVLVAEYLDFVQGKGMKKMRKLPYWIQNWIFYIINQKGLIYLNNNLNQLNFIDEAVLDAKQNAKKWRLGGITY